MDRFWQWVWDRYGPRFSWALYAVAVPLSMPVYLLWSFLIVAVEKSGHYGDAAAVTVVAAAVLQWVAIFLGLGASHCGAVGGRSGGRSAQSLLIQLGPVRFWLLRSELPVYALAESRCTTQYDDGDRGRA